MSERAEMPAERAVAFGPFRLFPERKLLLEGDRSIRLGSRALDILVALVERPGTLVSKEDLIARAWPNTFVEEANLRVHVAALRKALGDGRNGHRYLATDPGRGYRFVAPVSLSPAPEGAASAAEADTPRYSLPGLISRMIGRGDVVAALVNQLTNRRLVTITGPGGIGKTTVALSVAYEFAGICRDGVRFVDLAPLSNPSLVPSVLASAFGLTAIDEALARSQRHEERWCVAELLRRKGEIVLRAGRPGAAGKAEQHFTQALDWSRRQGARSWELRTATSLADLRREQGRVVEARDVLAPVYGQFREGFETRDLRAAKRLLDQLADADKNLKIAIVTKICSD